MPDDRLTLSTAAPFDPAATCPRWLRVVRDIFDGDVELTRYVQRAIGYSLTGETSEQCLFLHERARAAHGERVRPQGVRTVTARAHATAGFTLGSRGVSCDGFSLSSDGFFVNSMFFFYSLS